MNKHANHFLQDHRPFLLWMVFIGIICFAFWMTWRIGWLSHLFLVDKSHISLIIFILFAAMTIHCGIHNAQLSQLLHDAHNKKMPALNDTQLHNNYEFGWFMVDVLIKLGLLGTVVGFILMLSSLGNITHLDIEIAQKLMVEMGSGMGVALYTTLSGLICAIFLSAQYYLLESCTHHLLAQNNK